MLINGRIMDTDKIFEGSEYGYLCIGFTKYNVP
jgi:hypothetical protein